MIHLELLRLNGISSNARALVAMIMPLMCLHNLFDFILLYEVDRPRTRLHLYQINLNVRYHISCQRKLLRRMMSLNAVDKTLSPDMTYSKTLSLFQLFITD